MYEALQGVTGTVKGVYLSPIDSSSSFEMEEREYLIVAGEGIAGDRHAGLTKVADGRTSKLYPRGVMIANTRKVSLVSVLELQEIARRLGIGEVTAQALAANILVEDVPNFTRLPTSIRLHFYRRGTEPPEGRTIEGDTVLRVEGQNLPCIGPGKILQAHHPSALLLERRFVGAAMHLRGLVADVELSGYIYAGDNVRLFVPDQLRLT